MSDKTHQQYLDNAAYDNALSAAAVCLRAIPQQALISAIQKLQRAESVGPLLHPSAWVGNNSFKAQRLAIKALQCSLAFREVLAQQDKELHGVDNILADENGVMPEPHVLLFELSRSIFEQVQALLSSDLNPSFDYPEEKQQ